MEIIVINIKVRSDRIQEPGQHYVEVGVPEIDWMLSPGGALAGVKLPGTSAPGLPKFSSTSVDGY